MYAFNFWVLNLGNFWIINWKYWPFLFLSRAVKSCFIILKFICKGGRMICFRKTRGLYITFLSPTTLSLISPFFWVQWLDLTRLFQKHIKDTGKEIFHMNLYRFSELLSKTKRFLYSSFWITYMRWRDFSVKMHVVQDIKNY